MRAAATVAYVVLLMQSSLALAALQPQAATTISHEQSGQGANSASETGSGAIATAHSNTQPVAAAAAAAASHAAAAGGAHAAAAAAPELQSAQARHLPDLGDHRALSRGGAKRQLRSAILKEELRAHAARARYISYRFRPWSVKGWRPKGTHSVPWNLRWGRRPPFRKVRTPLLSVASTLLSCTWRHILALALRYAACLKEGSFETPRSIEHHKHLIIC